MLNVSMQHFAFQFTMKNFNHFNKFSIFSPSSSFRQHTRLLNIFLKWTHPMTIIANCSVI
jgi:hypothetical protein